MMLRRVYTLLRSRRLAIWLLVGITTYTLALTVLPVPPVSRPYANPVFAAVVVLLTLSTATCAWERTSEALRALRRSRAVAGAQPLSAMKNPSFRVPLQEGVSEGEALAAAAAAFRRCGLRCEVGETAAIGSAHTLGYLGSPLFHWALVALFLSASLGQLTRFEGLINVVTGGSVADVASTYSSGSLLGPLFLGRYTGSTIGVDRIAIDYEAGGEKRGSSPRVTISAGGRVRDDRYVYPNSPAAGWPLTVHRDATGAALLVGFRFPNGQETTGVPAFLPVPSEGTSLAPSTLTVSSDTGEQFAVRIQPLTGKRVVIGIESAGFSSAPLAVGGFTTLPDGTELRVESFTTYSRLRVVNDWTIPVVFAAFYAALAGLVLSLFWPARRAVAAVDPDYGTLDVRTSRRKTDPAFPSRVKKAVRLELGAVIEQEESA